MEEKDAQKCHSNHPMLRQQSSFPEIVCSAYLLAQSPKMAFYRIWIACDVGVYTVFKESGIKDQILDRRTWPQASLADAWKFYDRCIRSKTNPDRRCPRKYTTVSRI